MKTVAAVLIAGLGFAAGAAAQDCGLSSPPSRASNSYWSYIDTCGCDRVEAPPRASFDFDRYLKACAAWRERTQGRPGVVVLPGAATLGGKQCESSPPSRSSGQFWSYLAACGCDRTDTPSRASSDYERYIKACSDYRERARSLVVLPTPTPSPTLSPTPSPTPTPSPAASLDSRDRSSG